MNKKLLFNKFKTKKLIWKSQLSVVYEGINVKENEPVVIKFTKRKNLESFETEAYILFNLKGFGIPKIIAFGKNNFYSILVEELLGLSIFKLWQFKKNIDLKIKIKNVCMIALQALDRIEYIHSKNYIHKDIKPSNFLIGKKNDEIIYLIDFGFAIKYRSSKTGKHIKFHHLKCVDGTPLFLSINGVKGYEQSRKDDLESLGYMLIYLVFKSLPWIQACQNKDVSVKSRMGNILKIKTSTSTEMLCKGLPEEFSFFINYCKNLKFEEDPNYDYLRNLFKNILDRNYQKIELKFFWIINKKKRKSEELKKIEGIDFSRRKKSFKKNLYNKIKESLEKNRNNNNYNKGDGGGDKNNTNNNCNSDKKNNDINNKNNTKNINYNNNINNNNYNKLIPQKLDIIKISSLDKNNNNGNNNFIHKNIIKCKNNENADINKINVLKTNTQNKKNKNNLFKIKTDDNNICNYNNTISIMNKINDSQNKNFVVSENINKKNNPNIIVNNKIDFVQFKFMKINHVRNNRNKLREKNLNNKMNDKKYLSLNNYFNKSDNQRQISDSKNRIINNKTYRTLIEREKERAESVGLKNKYNENKNNSYKFDTYNNKNSINIYKNNSYNQISPKERFIFLTNYKNSYSIKTIDIKGKNMIDNINYHTIQNSKYIAQKNKNAYNIGLIIPKINNFNYNEKKRYIYAYSSTSTI